MSVVVVLAHPLDSLCDLPGRIKPIRTGCERIPEGGHQRASSLDEPPPPLEVGFGVEERSVGVVLVVQSGRQDPETKTSKGLSGKPLCLVVDISGRKGGSRPSYTSHGPWTILGSSGQSRLNTKHAYPETFGVHVLPQSG